MYINTQTLEYPVSERQIRDTNPDTIFPVPFSPPEQYEPVFQSPTPTINNLTQAVREVAPVLTGKGHYEQAWEVYDLPDEAVSANIESRKVSIIAAVNQRRDTYEAAGFPYLGKILDSDSRSVQRINTAVQAAQAASATGQPFNIEWVCADGTTLALDAQGMLGVPVALAMYADALHRHARLLKAMVIAASTVDELFAIDISAGWPNLQETT